jgi:hypothetical protein
MHMRTKFQEWPIVLLILLTSIHVSRAQNTHQSGGQPLKKVPSDVILIKGAWSASSDSSTPLPEDGAVIDRVYKNEYFGLSYALPNHWAETFKGPPPSDTGRYVLAQIEPTTTAKGAQLLVSAQDMFFMAATIHNAPELAAYERDNLQSNYELELPISQTKIAGHPFSFFAYGSPAAELHWYVLETEVRCHTLEFVFTGRDPRLLESLVKEMRRMSLFGDSGAATDSALPLCIKDYAKSQQLIRRVDPIFSEHRFNAVPVRIIVDTHGKIEQIHFLSAFPDQQKAITDALKEWQFKPYSDHGKPVEVETGLMFGTSETGSVEQRAVN